MESLKNTRNLIISKIFVFFLMATFLFFLFETYQDSYNNYKQLKASVAERQIEIAEIKTQIDEWNLQIENLNDVEKLEQILRMRGYGYPGEVLYRFEVPEPVTPIEETLKARRSKSVIEQVVEFIVGVDGE